MKNACYIFVLTIITTACGTVKNNNTNAEAVMPRIMTGDVEVNRAVGSEGDTLHSSIGYEFYTQPDSLFQKRVNALIKKRVLEETQFDGEQPVDGNLSEKFFEAQLDSFAGFYINEAIQNDFGGVWELNADFSIDESFETFVQVNSSAWAYTGGAHGNGYYVTHIFNKNSGDEMALTDFISDIDALAKIAEPYFRAFAELGPNDDLEAAGFWFEDNKFHLNENFSFSTGYLMFFFNQYEIAPYAAGTFEVQIPREKINHLIKQPFR